MRRLRLIPGMLFLAVCFSAAGATWRPVGPFGGAAEAVVIDPSAPDRLIAATRNGLLYRSENAGQNWQLLPFPHELSGVVHALAVAPGTTSTFYVGLSHPGGCGAFRSTDAGGTWLPMKDLCFSEIFSMAVSRSDPKVLAAGCRDGVYLTRDGGDSWSRISPRENLELQPIMSLSIDPDNQTIYAGTPHLPWRTKDGGKSWQSIHNGMIDDSDVFSIEVDPKSAEQVYASACSGIYSSRDRGASWTKLMGVPRTSRRTYTIRTDPSNPETLYAGTSRGLWKSLDSGAHWKQISPLIVKSIAFDPRNTKRLYLATEDQGMMTSPDGADTTQPINTGFFHRQLSALTPAPGGMFTAMLAGFGASGLYRYSRAEDRWDPLVTDSTAPNGISSIALLSGTMLVSAYDKILRSTDGGKRWTAAAAPWKTARVHSMVAIKGNPAIVVAATAAGVYRTEDLGMTWKPVPVASNVDSIYAAATETSHFMAQTSDGLFRSEDRGRTWTKVTLPAERSSIYDIAVGEGKVVLAGTTRGLFRSTDGGETWQGIAGVLSSGTVRNVIFHPTTAQAFAILHNSVYESRDQGATWSLLPAPGLERCSVQSLAIDPDSPGDIYALTRGKGVYMLRTETGEAASAARSQPQP